MERDVEVEVRDLIQSAVIIFADRKAELIAEKLWNTEQDVRDLGRVLTIRYLAREINAERRKAKPKREILPLFPDLELPVPQRIVTPEGKHPLLAKSTATEIRAYVKTLNNRHRNRIAGLQAVLEIMERYTKTNRGMTAAEVAQREAETAS